MLGPVIFTLYIQPLSAVVSHHSLFSRSFSDGSRLYVSALCLSPSQSALCLVSAISVSSKRISSSQACISHVQAWMHHNKLQLHTNKVEIILTTPKQIHKSPALPSSIQMNGGKIPLSASVQNLVITHDQTFFFQQHKTCQTVYFKLKHISWICRFFTGDAAKTLVTSYILSWLDYYDCLLMGTPNSVIQPLQKIQNFAARLVLLAPHHHHSTPLRKKTALVSHVRTY